MKKIYLVIPCILISMISCENKDDDNNPKKTDPVEIVLPEKSEEVITASNNFGFDIFRLMLADESSDKNLFISPTSISLALGMTLNGANNATEDSMICALRMSGLTMDQINATYRDLIDGLTTADEKVLLAIANSIWYRNGFTVEDGFLAINADYYNAEIAGLDFDSPEAVDIINNWCAEHTNDRIPEIITEIDPAQVMFLINAIYFKGIWKTEFNPESTYDGSFYLANGTVKTVSTMAMEEEIGYYENDLFQACELDYGRGNYSMVVLLPKFSASIDMITEQLNTENWTDWMASIQQQKVKLSLPKFTFGYEKRLNDILTAMGMGVAFDPFAADFTGMHADGGIYIGFVKHKTFVEVNEEGTEAAAVTIVGMEFTSIDPNAHVSMYVDHPFIIAIREKTSGAIVFIGKVAEPVVED